MQKRRGLLSHTPIDFYFQSSPRDFVVSEVPLYEASGIGEHLYVKIRKKNLSTFELLTLLANTLGVKKNEIGYAGLKDKQALTTQHISLPKKYRSQLEQFQHNQVKILSIDYHDNKLRIGHLKGNRFFMRLKKVNPTQENCLQSVLNQIKTQGMANYFGHQRFGNDGDNYKIAQDILAQKIRMRDKQKKQFFISALQSHLFNQWLSKRVEFSILAHTFTQQELQSIYPSLRLQQIKNQPHPFKIFEGEIMAHYPYGKIFYAEDTITEANRFHCQDIVPTGLVCGKKVKKSLKDAAFFEKDFLEEIPENGSRRAAWIFPYEIEYSYIKEEAQVELHFSLPKGAYASVFLEQLGNKDIQNFS